MQQPLPGHNPLFTSSSKVNLLISQSREAAKFFICFAASRLCEQNDIAQFAFPIAIGIANFASKKIISKICERKITVKQFEKLVQLVAKKTLCLSAFVAKNHTNKNCLKYLIRLSLHFK